MNLIKQLNTTANTRSIQLDEVKISRTQFRHLLESLAIRGLITQPLVPNAAPDGSITWLNDAVGNVSIATSNHPMFATAPLSLDVVGSKDQIIEVMSVLTTLGVAVPNDYRQKIVYEADVEYHTTLNPVLWDKVDGKYELKTEIEDVLLEAAARFIDFLKTPSIAITDITLTGSCANYNWTDTSDIDLHVVVDMKKSKDKYGELLPEYFDAKKRVWNDLHDIRIKNIPVEFYVQDQDEKHHSTGIYSLQDSDWINTPTHNPPTIDDIAVKEKVAALIKEIDAACTSNKASVIEDLHKKLVALRKRGLERGGEFSTENVTFKQLRSKGYLDKLAQCKVKAFDRELSIEDEEWMR